MTNDTKATSTKKSTKPVKRRAETKAKTILRLLNRSSGAKIAELAKATRWQHRSVRRFLSGTVRKRMGLPLQSTTNDKGIRRYSIQSDGEAA